MSKAAIPCMRKQGWDRVINISSMVAELGGVGHAAVSASKAVVLGFTRALADDVSPQGITIMAINPMVVMTSRGEAAVKRTYGDEPGAANSTSPCVGSRRMRTSLL